MKKVITKSSKSADERKQLRGAVDSKKTIVKRIDEEILFNLFTANIMKLKKKFVR